MATMFFEDTSKDTSWDREAVVAQFGLIPGLYRSLPEIHADLKLYFVKLTGLIPKHTRPWT